MTIIPALPGYKLALLVKGFGDDPPSVVYADIIAWGITEEKTKNEDVFFTVEPICPTGDEKSANHKAIVSPSGVFDDFCTTCNSEEDWIASCKEEERNE